MSEMLEYGEDEFDDDEIMDEEDQMRMAILEAEANEVWQEEPGDEEDAAQLQNNPLFGMLSSMGGLNTFGFSGGEVKDHEDPEH